MTLTLDQLIACMPGCSQSRATQFLDAINETLAKYDITTPLRAAHFLAQVGHESGSLRYSEEIASGSAYEGRKDLGNTQAGDGVKFKGRGLIQITGRANYTSYGNYVQQDFLTNSTTLAQSPWAADSAGWFWNSRKLNDLADQDNITAITKKINGGTNGLQDRTTRYQTCKNVIGVA